MKAACCQNIEIVLHPVTLSYIYSICTHIYHIPLFVTLKMVYDQNVVNKYRLYLLLGVIIFDLIDYAYIYTDMLEVKDTGRNLDVYSKLEIINQCIAMNKKTYLLILS